jgi:hydrogenase nickel incorporation protein HypA/HybF
MHELGIANSILETLKEEAHRRRIVKVFAVGLRVGELSGVNPEALRFSFECLKQETDFAATGLEIQRTPWRQRCSQCQREFTVIDYELTCPDCGERRTTLLSGDEMEIAYIEVEEHEARANEAKDT